MSISYKKGQNFESYIKRKLEKHGYFVVRSAGSKGVFDLIAFPPDDYISKPLGIQCKTHDKFTEHEKQRMIETAEKYGLLPVLATKFNNKVVLVNLQTESLMVGL